MTDDEVAHIARLLSQRNAIDDTIAAITHRLMAAGHLGEWIAAQVFDIELEQSSVTAAIDGRFRFGPLQGCTVNVKWCLKQERLLDMNESSALDYYLGADRPVICRPQLARRHPPLVYRPRLPLPRHHPC